MTTSTQATLREVIKKLVGVLANLPSSDRNWFTTKLYILQCSDDLKKLYEYLEEQYEDH